MGDAEQDKALLQRVRRRCGVLPLRSSVLFPSETRSINCGRPRTIQLVEWALANREKLLIAAAQRSEQEEDPEVDDLFAMGTAARIVKIIRLGPTSYSAVLHGLGRVRLRPRGNREAFLTAGYERVAVGTESPNEVLLELLEAARRCLPGLRGVDQAQLARLGQVGALGDLADGVAACLGYATEMRFRQKLLETQGPVDRAEMLLSWLER